MKNITIQSNVCFCSYDELDAEAQQLIEKAKQATDNSNSKYSGFSVGAALRLNNGMVIIGANQENAAFPVTICAERSAIFNAQSNYPQESITHIAIAARNNNGFTDIPVSPCGSCRQVLLEMEDRYSNNIKIYLYGKNGVYIVESAKDLLPLSFVDSSMR